jgi:hypothetical protein
MSCLGLAAITALSLTTANAQESDSDDTDVVEFEWDVSAGPTLNSAVVLTGDTAGQALFSAGISASTSLGVRAGGKGEDGEGYFTIMGGGSARTETPTGLIPGEANSRSYIGHLVIGGDFDWTGSKNDDDPDFRKFTVNLLAGGGPKLSYGVDGERLTDSSGEEITQTVLMFGARATTNEPSRMLHIAPNLLFTFGGPDSMELPATLAFSLTTGITL